MKAPFKRFSGGGIKVEKLLRTYYEDNAWRLHRMVDRILTGFGGLADKDKDDFYSLANEVFADVIRRYDHSQPFDAFLYSCLCNHIKTEMTRRNREKRRADRMSVSLDAPVGGEGHMTVADVIADEFMIEREVFEKKEEGYSRRVRCYLCRLSKLQREMLRLDMDGYQPKEIKEILHLSQKQYADGYAAIHSYRNVSVLL